MSNDVENNGQSAPEVLEKPLRRRFTAECKVRIIKEANACTDRGQVGELLRREGLYASHLSNWRLRKKGSLASLKEKKRSRKRKPNDVATQQLKRLQRENRRLTKRLHRDTQTVSLQANRPPADSTRSPQTSATENKPN